MFFRQRIKAVLHWLAYNGQKQAVDVYDIDYYHIQQIKAVKENQPIRVAKIKQDSELKLSSSLVNEFEFKFRRVNEYFN